MDLKGLKINVLGDSITFGHGTSDPRYVFWNLLNTEDGACARGYGISGTRIARQQTPSAGYPEFDQYFRTRVASMDPDADVVLVLGGTNDYGHGDAPLGRMPDRTDDTFYGAVHNLCIDLINRYPESVIAFMTPTHRADEHRAVNEWGVRNVGCLEDYVNIIQEVAGYYSLPVIDLYRTSGLQPEVEVLRRKYVPDGLHPNDAGNRRIYLKVREFLLSL